MRTFTFDTADVACDEALAFGRISLTVPDERGDETLDALERLGFDVDET